MTRKRHFIISRNTWRLHQFEFSVACSYQDCLNRMRRLEAGLKYDHELVANKNPSATTVTSDNEPFLELEETEDASSFELHLKNIVVSGTVQLLTEENTLFVGISQFSADFPEPIPLSVFTDFLLVGIFGVGAIFVFILLSVLSAYVSPNQISKFPIDLIGKFAILGYSILIVASVINYLIARWQLERAVKLLMDSFSDCSN